MQDNLGSLDADSMSIDSPHKDGIAERKILCKLVNSPNLIIDIDNVILKDSDFAFDIAKYIYNAIKALAHASQELQNEDPVDSALLEAKIAELYGNYYSIHLKTFKQALMKVYGEMPPADRDFKAFIKLVIMHSVKRKSIKKLEQISLNIESVNDPQKIVSHLEQETLNFTSNLFTTANIETVGQDFDIWLKNKQTEVQEGKVSVGIKTGFKNYDAAIGGGYRAGTVNVIAARAKMGKSFIASIIANHIIKNQQAKVLLLDTELDNDYQTIRRCANISNVPLHCIEHGTFMNSADSVNRVKSANKFMKENPIHYVDIKGWGIDEQVSVIRRFFSKVVGKDNTGKYNPALVILDYLKLMDPKDKGDSKEWETIGYRMTALHDLMGEMNNPMLMFCQRNRTKDEDETTISQSDRITWFADNVTIFSKLSDEEVSARVAANQNNGSQQRPENCKLKVIASRHGPGTSGKKFIGMYADIHDTNLKVDQVCGKIEERSLQTSMI